MCRISIIIGAGHRLAYESLMTVVCLGHNYSTNDAAATCTVALKRKPEPAVAMNAKAKNKRVAVIGWILSETFVII